jgi:hypothetical protein
MNRVSRFDIPCRLDASGNAIPDGSGIKTTLEMVNGRLVSTVKQYVAPKVTHDTTTVPYQHTRAFDRAIRDYARVEAARIDGERRVAEYRRSVNSDAIQGHRVQMAGVLARAGIYR